MQAPVKFIREPKNRKAVAVGLSWLQAVGIPVAVPAPGQGDLAIKQVDGEVLVVDLLLPDEPPRAGRLGMQAKLLGSPDREVALKAFHAITELAGYGQPIPIDRGEQTAKVTYENDFELVAMRHREFRASPNPTTAELVEYTGTIAKAVARFMYINRTICQRHGLEREDLTTYAQVWTCNFLGLYRVARPNGEDNKRKLYSHLCQRFGNFIELLMKKERSVVVDRDTAAIGTVGEVGQAFCPDRGFRVRHGRPLFPGGFMAIADEGDPLVADSHWSLDVEHEVGGEPILDDEVEEEEVDLDKEYKTQQRAASRKLKKALASLPHEKLIDVLTETAQNDFLAPDVREEATKQLRLHSKKCAQCSEAQAQKLD